MAEQKKQSLLNGALVLSMAVVAVKLIGVFFKLYVTLKIGYDGKGYYATAYNIYAPIYSIALAGFPTAVSKMVAAKAAEGRYRDVRALFKISLRIFTLAGAAGTILILLIAFPYTKTISSYDSIPAILAIAPSMFFCCVMSGYRGYYQGLRDMTSSAISQVIEAAGKLIFGWVLINSVVGTGAFFADKIPVLNKLVTDSSQAYAAAAAIAGVTIGSLMGLIYFVIRHKVRGEVIPIALLRKSPKQTDASLLTREFIAISIPIAISALVTNVTTLIDNWTVQNRLQYVLDNHFDVIAAMYPDIIAAKKFTAEAAEQFKSYLYGAFDTVLEIKNIVPTFTVTLGLSAIPVLSEAWVKKDNRTIQKSIDAVLRITGLIAFPCGIGMFVLAEDILWLLYGNSEVNAPAIPYIAPILMMYGISVIFLALTQPITSMLQAVDRMDVPIKSMLIGAVVKIVSNLVFVGIPAINIQGAAIGSIACNIIIVVYGMIVLKRDTKMKFNWIELVVKPLGCAAASGAAAFAVSRLFAKLIPSGSRNIATIMAVLTAVIIYAVALILTGAIKEEDVLALPKGEKIVKVLAKYGLIG